LTLPGAIATSRLGTQPRAFSATVLEKGHVQQRS